MGNTAEETESMEQNVQTRGYVPLLNLFLNEPRFWLALVVVIHEILAGEKRDCELNRVR